MLGSLTPGLVLVLYEAKNIMGLGIRRYVKDVIGFHLIPMVASFVSVCLLRKTPAAATLWMLVLVPFLLCAYFFLMIRLGWVPLRRFAKQLGVQEGEV
jgi:hypothetical protein